MLFSYLLCMIFDITLLIVLCAGPQQSQQLAHAPPADYNGPVHPPPLVPLPNHPVCTQTRARIRAHLPAYGGHECSGPEIEERYCQSPVCHGKFL